MQHNNDSIPERKAMVNADGKSCRIREKLISGNCKENPFHFKPVNLDPIVSNDSPKIITAKTPIANANKNLGNAVLYF